MKIFVLAFLAGMGYKAGEFFTDCLIGFIHPKRRKNRVSYYDHRQ